MKSVSDFDNSFVSLGPIIYMLAETSVAAHVVAMVGRENCGYERALEIAKNTKPDPTEEPTTESMMSWYERAVKEEYALAVDGK